MADKTGTRPTRTAEAALAALSLPMAMLTLPLVVNVPEYFGNALGLNLAVVGTIFMAVRIFDIVVDPALGLMMDSTDTRWGRFRPWLVAGVPVFIAGTAMLFMARAGVGSAWLVAGLVLAYLGWSILSLAQLSMAAGLVRDYAARARIYAWIQAAFLGGICVIMLLPLLIRARDAASGLSAMGWLIIATVIPAVLLVLALVPERLVPSQRHRLGLAGYARLIARPPVARLVAADLLFGIGFGIASAVLVFFFIAAKGFDRSVLGVLLIAQMGTGLIAVPLLGALAARIGKHVVLGLCGLGATAICPMMFLVPQRGLVPAAIVMAIWGIFYGGVTFVPRAMMADAGDELRLDEGVDRTGVLYALLISSWKLGGALSVGIGFIALDLIGYVPKLGAANAPHALVGLQLLFAGSPALLGLLGALLCWRYPLNAARCAEIRAALDARDAALAPPSDPDGAMPRPLQPAAAE
ncbi:MAG: glycoside/pentoside/hexuronide:cation symporter, family [Sphingomonadales bacterium]|jgi:Na+/melibiose symporter-like transporter|nr:glycoside/pentoside/hexuronide:cation symporter, family [Sphingomonadales bacterium]